MAFGTPDIYPERKQAVYVGHYHLAIFKKYYTKKM